MKKLLMSKKVLAATALALLMGVYGLSGAWFTDDVGIAKNKAKFGNIKIEATVNLPDVELDKLSPGDDLSLGATITNAGNLPAFVQIQLDMAKLPKGLEGLITSTADPKEMNKPGDFDTHYWLETTEQGAEKRLLDSEGKVIKGSKVGKQYFLVMMEGAENITTADWGLSFDGAIGNEFELAEFDFEGAFKATQIDDRAGVAMTSKSIKGGLSWIDEDLQIVEPPVVEGFSAFSSQSLYDKYYARAVEMLGEQKGR